MSSLENNHPHLTRLSLGKRGVESISKYLPLSFFQLSLQDWLRSNATVDKIILHLQLPWCTYFPFLCWNLWLAKNDRIFKHQSRSQHSLIHSPVQVATEFHFLVGSISQPQVRIPQLIKWTMPPTPYIKLNIDGSAISNSGLAGAGGILQNHSGECSLDFPFI